MYAWLISAIVLAGCLRNPVSPNHPVSDPKAAAKEVWKSYLQRGEYDKAAQIASEHHLGAMEIDIALHYARLDAKDKKDVYRNDPYGDNSEQLKTAMNSAYKSEVIIACLYGPSKLSSPVLVIKDIQDAHSELNDNGPLYLLLNFDCPLSHDLRYRIIEAAANENLDDYALLHALRSNWNANDKMEFVKIYIAAGKCSFGLKAALQLGVKPDEIDQLLHLSDCEKEKLDSKGWTFPPEVLRRYFFSAMRLRKYNLALEFNQLAGGSQDGVWHVIHEAFDKHDEYTLSNLIVPRPELRDLIFDYALANGRARFVGMQTKEIVWQQRAFDKLIEERRYDDAAEVAEFGISQTLKTEGILVAFRATMTTGNFEHGRFYFKTRYPKIITSEEYDKAAATWFKAHPGEKRLAPPSATDTKVKDPPKPRDPNCIPSAPGDWAVKRC